MGKGHEQTDGRQREKNKQPIYLKCHTISLIKLKMERKKDFFQQISKKKCQSLLTLVLLRVLGKNTSVTWCNVYKKENCTAGNLSCPEASKKTSELSISIDSFGWYSEINGYSTIMKRGAMHLCVLR